MSPLAPESIERWRRRARSRAPLLGAWLRRSALAALDAVRDDPAAVALLAELAQDARVAVRQRALRCLRGLAQRRAIDALCEQALQDPRSAAAAVCLARGWRPSDPERACLFLFVTRQLDAYFEEDFEFQNLRLEYDRADARLQQLVLEVVRSGDPRSLGFLGSRKRLRECSERELRVALQSFLKHGDGPRLFQAFLELPLRFGIPILRELRALGWQPQDPAERSLLQQALADIRGHVIPQSQRREMPATLWCDWLSREAGAALDALGPEALLERLRSAPLAAGPGIVAAVARQPTLPYAALAAVEASPHWLVRLAGAIHGLCADPRRDAPDDAVIWANELAPSVPFLELWPHHGAPEHLALLERAPAGAWAGGLGAARKVLRLLLAHRLTTGSFEAMLVEPDEFAAAFEPVEGE